MYKTVNHYFVFSEEVRKEENMLTPRYFVYDGNKNVLVSNDKYNIITIIILPILNNYIISKL